MENVNFDQILSYIDSHICEKIRLGDLAELAGYSPFYFSRLFSEAMGMPVTGYIRIRKLQYAMTSLLEAVCRPSTPFAKICIYVFIETVHALSRIISAESPSMRCKVKIRNIYPVRRLH